MNFMVIVCCSLIVGGDFTLLKTVYDTEYGDIFSQEPLKTNKY